MELRLFDYYKDDCYVDSFLNSASHSHNEPKKTKEWFYWKFTGSPYGKAILACAFDNNEIVGCVALGYGRIEKNCEEFICCLSYETFVNPKYQGMGLFKKLIVIAEKEATINNVKLLYNFPNHNSLHGFKKLNWNILKSPGYYIKIVNKKRCIYNITNLKYPFIPNLPDYTTKNTNIMPIPHLNFDKDIYNPIWNEKYIEWRFFSYPIHHYYYIDNDLLFSIARIGYRGKLKEAQILVILSRNGNLSSGLIDTIIENIKKHVCPDIISYCCNETNITRKLFFPYIKVPNQINFTYKLLNQNQNNAIKISISGIDFHTY